MYIIYTTYSPVKFCKAEFLAVLEMKKKYKNSEQTVLKTLKSL